MVPVERSVKIVSRFSAQVLAANRNTLPGRLFGFRRRFWRHARHHRVGA